MKYWCTAVIFSLCGTKLDWNRWVKITDHLCSAFRAAPEQHHREAASQSNPIAMIYVIRLCLSIVYNAFHSCSSFRSQCLSDHLSEHLSEWKIWEVSNSPPRLLLPLRGLSLSLNKAVTPSVKITVLW